MQEAKTPDHSPTVIVNEPSNQPVEANGEQDPLSGDCLLPSADWQRPASDCRPLAEVTPSPSQQPFESLVQSLDGIVWEADAQTFRFTFVSKQAERILGYPASQWLNEPAFWADHMHPEDRNWAVDFCLRAIERKTDHQFEYRMIAADGRVVWLRDIVTVNVAADQPVCLRGMMVDITEQKRAEAELRASEERYRSLVLASAEIVWLTTADGEVLMDSPSWRALTGQSEAEIKDQGWLNAVHPEDREHTARVWSHAVKTRSFYETEYRIRTLAGVYRDFQVRGAPVINEDGTIREWVGTCTDITERKRVETALRESEGRWRTIFNDAAIGIALLDIAGRPIQSNPALQQLLGYTESELRRMSFAEFTHPEDADKDVLLYQELIAGARDHYQMEKRYIRKDGQVVWGNLIVSMIRDEQGRGQFVVGMAEDITERKRVEEALRASEERFFKTFNLSPLRMGVARIQDGVILDVNDRWLRDTGFAREEVIGHPIFELKSWIGEDEHPKLHALLKAGQPVRDLEGHLRTKAGEQRATLTSTEVIELGGEPCFLWAANDITERKRAEASLLREKQLTEQIMNSLPGVCYVFDEQGQFLRWNENFERVTGYSREELARISPLDLFVGNDREVIRACMQQVFVAGKSEAEVELVAKDGTRTPYYFTGRQALLGDKVCDVGMGIDITDRKRAEEQLKASSQQLRALTASLSNAREAEGIRIAREIHDELGAALTSLRWDLESLDKVISKSRALSERHGLQKKFASMIGLTDTIISSVRRIASELRPSILDDLGLAEAIEWQAQQFQARTGIICHCDCALENLALSDKQTTAVFRIFQEALTNILRHAQATRVEVSIEETQGELVLTISDNGKGITESEKAAPQSLGLLGMQERAHLVGGDITITGVAGKGTVVTVRVPTAGRASVLQPHSQ